MKTKILFGLICTVLVLAVIFSACTKTTSSTTTTSTTKTTSTTSTTKTTSTTSTTKTTSTTSTTKTTSTTSTISTPTKVLKMGTTWPLNSPLGLQGKKWFDLYAKMVNDAGGWKIGNDTYQLQIIVYDDQGDVTKAGENMRRLVLQDGCKFILAGQTNNVGVDITITEPAHVIVIGTDLTNNAADPKVQYYYTTGNYFGGAGQYTVQKDVTTEGVKSYVSVKPDSQLGHFIDMQLNASWKLADPGVEYLGTIFVDPTTIDFGPIATKAVNLHPDCIDLVYLGMIPNSVPQMYRSLADNGFNGVILPGILTQNDVDNLVTSVGKEIIEGGEVFFQDPTGYQKDPRMLSFMSGYIKEYGKLETDNIGALHGMFVLEDAINGTNSIDVDTIKAYLDHSDHPVRTMDGFVQLYARPDLGNFRTICGGPSGPFARITDGKLVYFSVSTLKDNYRFAVITAPPDVQTTYKAYWEQYGYPNFPAEEESYNTLQFSDLGITGHD